MVTADIKAILQNNGTPPADMAGLKKSALVNLLVELWEVSPNAAAVNSDNDSSTVSDLPMDTPAVGDGPEQPMGMLERLRLLFPTFR